MKRFKLPKAELSGRFIFHKIQCEEINGELVPTGQPEKVAEFNNLITDLGLNEIGTRAIDSAITVVQVGSGNAPPQNTDSGLVNVIATSSTQQSSTFSAQTATAPFYAFRRRTVRFSAGAAAGNLSEVGVGWATGNNLFSRALILDALGNPTTITVLPTEVLDVTYEIRIYPPETDFSGSLVLNGVTYNVTARAAGVDNGFLWTTSRSGASSSTTQNRAYDGNIADVLSSPSGTSAAGVTQFSSYANNSLRGEVNLFFDLDFGNIGGIRSVLLAVGFTGWQFELSSQIDGTPFPKDNQRDFTFGAVVGWGRRAA